MYMHRLTRPALHGNALWHTPLNFAFDFAFDFAFNDHRYIPTKKLPSSARAEKTHKRLCQHENFAKISKECCAFPELPVKSVSPQEVLKRDGDGLMQPATVSDIAGNLCNDFKTWSEEKFLFDVKDDWGWFELTSKA
mmetsp:Transcript_24391/g.67955  ORF Transcript_24391/g.67955 Transcript_24391/m.67955 type:complete len:137 (-) Transcript_24391:900-1310(-)